MKRTFKRKLEDFICKRVYVEVGDLLECVKWGAEWVVIEVTDVSLDGRAFNFIFKVCKGDSESMSGDKYESSTSFLHDRYKHLEVKRDDQSSM